MPCKNACAIIDTMYINIYKQIISFSFILIKKWKGLRNGHNYIFTAEFIKRKIEGEENKHEIGSFIPFGINVNKPFVETKQH